VPRQEGRPRSASSTTTEQARAERTLARVKVTVLLFGGAAEIAGSSSVRVEVEREPVAAVVLAALGRSVPALEPVLPSARLAVNHEFARPDQMIREGDEVALIALVSGG